MTGSIVTGDAADALDLARAYAARFGLVPIDPADAERLAMLFDRAAATGAAVPRQTDKEVEPYAAAVITARHPPSPFSWRP